MLASKVTLMHSSTLTDSEVRRSMRAAIGATKP
ncbi:Uncharacterised protein [Bordetella pertussis]|nr:Uncharacterised protein [Bordetella pertussis]